MQRRQAARLNRDEWPGARDGMSPRGATSREHGDIPSRVTGCSDLTAFRGIAARARLQRDPEKNPYAACANRATGFSTATRTAAHEWAWIARGFPCL
jgi:hypothetical protein